MKIKFKSAQAMRDFLNIGTSNRHIMQYRDGYGHIVVDRIDSANGGIFWDIAVDADGYEEFTIEVAIEGQFFDIVEQ
ncbi:mRNA metabolism modulator [Aeromonas phage GomatiRiver_11]|nr:hypothetical protein OBDJBBDK_00158 [Aeromonas phage AhFM11]WKW84334.1 mRNA metabolism modulator [Aeromonas phage GomatiRiver_11]